MATVTILSYCAPCRMYHVLRFVLNAVSVVSQGQTSWGDHPEFLRRHGRADRQGAIGEPAKPKRAVGVCIFSLHSDAVNRACALYSSALAVGEMTAQRSCLVLGIQREMGGATRGLMVPVGVDDGRLPHPRHTAKLCSELVLFSRNQSRPSVSETEIETRIRTRKRRRDGRAHCSPNLPVTCEIYTLFFFLQELLGNRRSTLRMFEGILELKSCLKIFNVTSTSGHARRRKSGCGFKDSVGCGKGGRSRWRRRPLRKKLGCLPF
jgi:hypothetical protein